MNQDDLIASGIPANWYADPTGRAVQRYWNGLAWTAYVVDAQGMQRVDEPNGSPSHDAQSIHGSAAPHGIVIQNVIHHAPERPAFIGVPGLYGQGVKSTATALLLTFFFGPLGLFYVSAGWAIGMFLLALIALPLTLGLAVFILWPIWMVMAVGLVNRHNAGFMGAMAAPQPIHRDAPVFGWPGEQMPSRPSQPQGFNGQQSPPPPPPAPIARP